MITKTDDIKLIDFGNGVRCGPNSIRHHRSCTPHYASPEMHQRDPRYKPFALDAWSAGQTFFEMLTGRIMFDFIEENRFYEDRTFDASRYLHLAQTMAFGRRLSTDAIRVLTLLLAKDEDTRIRNLRNIQNDSFFLD